MFTSDMLQSYLKSTHIILLYGPVTIKFNWNNTLLCNVMKGQISYIRDIKKLDDLIILFHANLVGQNFFLNSTNHFLKVHSESSVGEWLARPVQSLCRE